MKKNQIQRDPRIGEIMVKNGVPCHSKALFLALTALAAKEKNTEFFETNMNVKETLGHKIAAKLVYDFLKRMNFKITLQIVQNEGDLHYFSQINHESANALKLRLNKPPIQKLVRMRFSKAGKIDSDDETTGWFDIDSEFDHTITMDGNSSTYIVDTGAWQKTRQDEEIEEESPQIIKRELSRRRKQASVAARTTVNDRRHVRNSFAKTDIFDSDQRKGPLDALSSPVQLVQPTIKNTSASYEEYSQRIVPVKSSSSGRRGRRTEEDQ